MLNVPKVLNICLGLATGFAIVVAVSNWLSPELPQSHCANIIDRGRIVGEKCTFDSGSLLERVELDADVCYDRMRHRFGESYALRACYDDGDQMAEKRPL